MSTNKPNFPLGKCPHPPGFHKPDREAAEARSLVARQETLVRQQAVAKDYGIGPVCSDCGHVHQGQPWSICAALRATKAGPISCRCTTSEVEIYSKADRWAPRPPIISGIK